MPRMSPRIKLRKGRLAGSVPVVTITSPVPAGSPPVHSVVGAGSPLTGTFSAAATAVDDVGGDVSANLRWTSNVDGLVGTGANPSITLSAGPHTLTASVTDIGGATGSDSIAVVVA